MMFETLLSHLQAYAGKYMPEVGIFILRVILCIIVFLIGRRVIAWLVRLLKRAMNRVKIDAGAVSFAASAAKILLYCVLIIWIALQFGIRESSVAALVASVGVAIGLALQGGLSNLVGGFLILLFQPFHVGDYIITQGQEGTVQKIDIMYTTLQTVDTRRIIIPNGTLANNVIVNVTAADRRKLDMKVTISYEDDLKKAKEVLERLIAENEDILQEEEHQVFVEQLGESGVVIGLRCQVPTEKYNAVLWEMNEAIKLEFDRAGLHLPFPQVEVHMKGNDK